MRYENAFLNTQWKAEELFMVSSQLFISYKQNQSILLWRSTFNLKSGVPASATWPRERHDMRSMYIVVLMTSGKRSWPQERLVLKLSNGPHETFLKKAITKDSNTKSYESLSTMNIIALVGQPSAAKEAKFKLAFLD